jgi:hypothetical protein
MMDRIMKVAILFLLLCITAAAFGAEPNDAAPGGTHVLIVSGISRDPQDRAIRSQTLTGLRACLRDVAKVDPRRVTVLTGDDPPSATTAGTSTAGLVDQAVKALASVVRPQDRFIFYYIGHANVVVDDLRFNLPGPDATQNDLAAWLGTIKARTQLVVLDCPCAGLAAKTLAAENRIIVCAATAEQTYSTRFTSFLIAVLSRPPTDANNDGTLSLLDAFTATAREIEQWYHQAQVLPTETPCLEDDGDGTPSERPWRHEIEGGDGARASAFILTEGR